MARVFQIDTVWASLQKSNPPSLLVHATGRVGSSGWKNIDLLPMEKKLSSDGILDLEFVGSPPAGITLPVLTDVSADYVITAEVEKIVGVIVHARSNSQATLLNAAAPAEGRFAVAGEAALSQLTTRAIGEEGPTTFALGEEGHTTFALGEEGSFFVHGETPPLSFHVEKFAVMTAEKPPFAETQGTTNPASDTALGMFNSPFGTR